jgi:hypothetical protein
MLNQWRHDIYQSDTKYNNKKEDPDITNVMPAKCNLAIILSAQ